MRLGLIRLLRLGFCHMMSNGSTHDRAGDTVVLGRSDGANGSASHMALCGRSERCADSKTNDHEKG